MIKFIIALVIVVAVLLSGFLTFRRNTRGALPSQDVIDRVRIREREIEAKERDS